MPGYIRWTQNTLKNKPEALVSAAVINKDFPGGIEELLQGLEEQEVKAQLEERMKQ